jgi:hypothetical protein
VKRQKQLDIGELQARGIVGLTKAQMAGALQISVRSLNGLMARGEVAYWRIGGRLIRFRVEDAVKRMNETVLVAADETVTSDQWPVTSGKGGK